MQTKGVCLGSDTKGENRKGTVRESREGDSRGSGRVRREHRRERKRGQKEEEENIQRGRGGQGGRKQEGGHLESKRGH